MGSTPPPIKSSSSKPVKFHGNWLRFTCLLEYAAIRAKEDAKEEMEAAQIARKHLKPQKIIFKKPKPVIQMEEHNEHSSALRHLKTQEIIFKEPKPVIQMEEHNEPSSSLPVLPRNFRNVIDEMGGSNVILVMEKFLFKTDVESKNGRLAMMFSKIRLTFLTETERRSMKNGENMNVMIIDPSLNVRTIVMAQWDMKKKDKKKKKSAETHSSSMYVLKKPWNCIVLENGLKKNDKVQVWSFRVGEELGLTLVLANRAI